MTGNYEEYLRIVNDINSKSPICEQVDLIKEIELHNKKQEAYDKGFKICNDIFKSFTKWI